MSRAPFVRDIFFPNCPIRNILTRIGDKWSMLVIYTLSQSQPNVLRFNEMQRAIPDISAKMLATTVKTLEQDGLVSRRIYAEVPPRVEYSLTPRAESLLPHLNSLIGWAVENMEPIVAHRRNATA